MLFVQLESASVFGNVLEALSDMFSEANFEFSGEGLELQAVDTNEVALVVFFLGRDAFKEYSCDDKCSMVLNLADMAKAFRCANEGDIITMEVEDDFSDIIVTFESPERGETFYHIFKFVGVPEPLAIPKPPESLKSPESEYQAIVRMPSTKFMLICNKLSSLNSGNRDNGVIITVRKEGVDFLTWGKTMDSRMVCKQTQTVDKLSDQGTHVEAKEEVCLTFDLSYMNYFSKVSDLSDQVTIGLSSEQPTVFEYKIGGMGSIRFYLMPMSNKDEMQNKQDGMQNEGDEIRK